MRRYQARLSKLETAAPSTQPRNILLLAPDADITVLESQQERHERKPKETRQAFFDRVLTPIREGITIWAGR